MARAIAAIDQPSIIEAGAATSCDRGRATLRQTRGRSASRGLAPMFCCFSI